MKLFENETNYQTEEIDFSYMLEGSKQEYCSIVPPKIEYSKDKKLMQAINLDLSREKIKPDKKLLAEALIFILAI